MTTKAIITKDLTMQDGTPALAVIERFEDTRAARSWLRNEAEDGEYAIYSCIEEGIKVRASTQRVVEVTPGTSYRQRTAKDEA